jgi:hypothetical protein
MFMFRMQILINCLILLMGWCFSGSVQAQPRFRYLEVGRMWGKFDDNGGGGWEESLIWPGGRYREMGQGDIRLMGGNARRFGPSIGVRDWKDEKGKSYAYMLSPATGALTRDAGAVGEAVSIKKFLRYRPPKVVVDGEDVGSFVSSNPYDGVDPTIPSEAMVEILYNYRVGLSCLCRVYSYSAVYGRDLMFYEYTFTNTGSFRSNNRVELPDQVLHKVGVSFSAWPHVSFEGASQNWAIWDDRNDDWGEYYGESYLDYIGAGTPLRPAGNPDADSLRLWVLWDGDRDPEESVGKEDDIGDPNININFTQPNTNMGEFLSPQYVGFGILHADRSVNDPSNDLGQPFTTTWISGRYHNIPAFKLDMWYSLLFSGEHRLSGREMGYTSPYDKAVVAPFGYTSVGLYEMPFGSSLRIVMLAAVDGLKREDCIRYGDAWYRGRLPEVLGDSLVQELERKHSAEVSPHAKDDNDRLKDMIVATGRDSLFRTFGLGTRVFFQNEAEGRNPFAIPAPPPAPDLTVTSGAGEVILEWGDVSDIPDPDTGVRDFAGYRIYRAKGQRDAPYTMIYEWRRPDQTAPVVTTYRDTTVSRAFAYYYYVTAFDDGSQNWLEPGRSLESGIFYNMTRKPAHPILGPERREARAVRVVPNPYDRRSWPLYYPGEPDKVMFVNLPARCTIRVYTVSGDLVKTIHHTSGTGDEPWNMVTDSNQYAVTGVYILTVESSLGTGMEKFVIIR